METNQHNKPFTPTHFHFQNNMPSKLQKEQDGHSNTYYVETVTENGELMKNAYLDKLLL